MTAPRPIAGNNPHTLGYQNSQYGSDTEPAAVVPSFTVLDHLATPPQSGINAESSPDKVFRENTDPPVGAGGNESGGIF